MPKANIARPRSSATSRTATPPRSTGWTCSPAAAAAGEAAAASVVSAVTWWPTRPGARAFPVGMTTDLGVGCRMQLRLPAFPNPVDEVAARTVAAGVVALAVGVLAGQRWLLVPLAYGFVARVLTGPRFSPLALVATRLVAPRFAARPVPGPPKRFAQAIGATFTVAALG